MAEFLPMDPAERAAKLEDLARALRKLRPSDLVAVPALKPFWSPEVPPEPGWYWHADSLQSAWLRQPLKLFRPLGEPPEGLVYREPFTGQIIRAADLGGVWWPERLPEPPQP